MTVSPPARCANLSLAGRLFEMFDRRLRQFVRRSAAAKTSSIVVPLPSQLRHCRCRVFTLLLGRRHSAVAVCF